MYREKHYRTRSRIALEADKKLNKKNIQNISIKESNAQEISDNWDRGGMESQVNDYLVGGSIKECLLFLRVVNRSISVL